MWRPEDEALLDRIEDELTLERLWRHHAGDAPPPDLHAAGLVTLVRSARFTREATPEGRAAVEAARAGRIEPLREVLYACRHDARAPELHHHLALFEAKVADAIAEHNPGGAFEANVRAMAAWLSLGEEKRYLRALAEAVVGAALSAREIDRALDEAPFARIDELGRQAREGARERTRRGATALAALASSAIADAARVSGCAASLEQAALQRAARLRTAAVDEAIAPLDEALSAASDRGDIVGAAPALFAEIAAAWAWAGEDEGVERFVVERGVPIAWDAYRAPGWDPLRKLMAPVTPLVARLAARIESDPTKIAYAAPCAQMLLFDAYMEPQIDRETALVERALRVCPSHRNARSRLAFRLVEAATRLFEPAGRQATRAELDAAEATLQRAEQCFAATEQLPEARAKLLDKRRRAGEAKA